MKKESLLTSMAKLITAVVLIVGIGMMLGLTGWLATNISKINIPIATAPVEKNITITINKIESEQGEVVKIAIRNNLDNSIWYRDDVYCYLEFNSGNAWVPSLVINMMVCPRGEIKELDSNREISYDIDFSNNNHIFYSGVGKYRISFKYNHSLENVSGKTLYSNEFTIKEKSALDLRCSEKVKGIGDCSMEVGDSVDNQIAEIGRVGYEFDSTLKKCVKKVVSGCSFEIPFKTLEECQEVCEKKENVEITGFIRMIGNEPFTQVVIESINGEVYGITGDKNNELKKLQTQKVKVKGSLMGRTPPSFRTEKSIEVTSFEIIE